MREVSMMFAVLGCWCGLFMLFSAPFLPEGSDVLYGTLGLTYVVLNFTVLIFIYEIGQSYD